MPGLGADLNGCLLMPIECKAESILPTMFMPLLWFFREETVGNEATSDVAIFSSMLKSFLASIDDARNKKKMKKTAVFVLMSRKKVTKEDYQEKFVELMQLHVNKDLYI